MVSHERPTSTWSLLYMLFLKNNQPKITLMLKSLFWGGLFFFYSSLTIIMWLRVTATQRCDYPGLTSTLGCF